VASFLERFEAEQKAGRKRTTIEPPSAAKRWHRDNAELDPTSNRTFLLGPKADISTWV